MQHMVNKAYTRWVAANLISGHMVHTGNHTQGTAGHRQGVVVTGGLTVLSCDAMRGNCDNCSYTHTQANLHKSAHCTCKVRTQ